MAAWLAAIFRFQLRLVVRLRFKLLGCASTSLRAAAGLVCKLAGELVCVLRVPVDPGIPDYGAFMHPIRRGNRGCTAGERWVYSCGNYTSGPSRAFVWLLNAPLFPFLPLLTDAF